MTQLRLATTADADEVGHVLAEGFSDDPVLTWVFRDPGSTAKLEAFFAFLAREAFVPTGTTWLGPDSCAVWTPPEPEPWPADRGERFSALLAEVCTGDDLRRLGVLEAAMEEAHPAGPLWYLSLLATVPAARGRGRGTALLERTLAPVDEAALPAYLESTNPRNVSLYLRHGFEAIGRIDLPDGPSLTTMWRPARPA